MSKHIIWTPEDAQQAARDAAAHPTYSAAPLRRQRRKIRLREWVWAPGLIVGAMLGAGLTAPDAKADDYTPGCERVDWGFLASGYRTICDGPVRADGSWDRVRREWTPGGYVPLRTSCSRYSCSSYGGYYRAESTQRFDTYVVFPHNVLPGEPGHLPAGALFIR